MSDDFTHKGIVVSWFALRGFGFIRFDDPPVGMCSEIFVHISDTPGHQPLAKNEYVSFTIGKFGGHYKAFDVEPVVREPEETANGNKVTP